MIKKLVKQRMSPWFLTILTLSFCITFNEVVAYQEILQNDTYVSDYSKIRTREFTPPAFLEAEINAENYVDLTWGAPELSSLTEVLDQDKRNDYLSSEKELTGYFLYRFALEDQGNEDLWDPVTVINDSNQFTYTDTEWAEIELGTYRYAIKAIYSFPNFSEAVFSQELDKYLTTEVIVEVTTNSEDSVVGTVVELKNIYNPEYSYSSTISEGSLAEFMSVIEGEYQIVASLGGFERYESPVILISGEMYEYRVVLYEALRPAVNLEYEIFAENNIRLNWSEPGTVIGTSQWLHWDNGENSHSLGVFYDFAYFQVAIRFTPEQLVEMDVGNQYLSVVRFFPTRSSATYTLKVWQGGYVDSEEEIYESGEEIYSQAISNPQINSWNDVTLDYPVQIDPNQELWLGYRISDNTGLLNAAGCDAGPAVQDHGNLVYSNGIWGAADPSVPFFNANWNLQGFVNDTREGQIIPLDRYENDLSNSPENERALLGYRVERNETVLQENTAELEFIDYDVPAGTYVYSVTALYTTGDSEPVYTEEINLDTTTVDSVVMPEPVRIIGNYPNPFNPNTVIYFQLNSEMHVDLSIYNVKGQKIKTLVNEILPEGMNQVNWNGVDSMGNMMGSGVYFYKLSSTSHSAVKKMILIK